MAIRPFGTNMQNWSKEQRNIVIAPPGYCIWQIDQSGAEALVVAYLCHNARFRSLFLNGVKSHVYVAMHLTPKLWAEKLGLPDINDYLTAEIPNLKTLKHWKDLEKLIKDSDNESNPKKRIYAHGKLAGLSLNYDAEWKAFQIGALKKSDGALAFTEEEAKHIRNLYRNTLFPELSYYHSDVIHQLESGGRVLRNLFGYPRKFNGPWDRELFKQGYAFIPQSTVGVITLMAQTEIQERLDNRDPALDKVSIWQNGHDSLMGIAREELVREQVTHLRTHLERTLPCPKEPGQTFKMKTGVSIGKNWGSHHPIKNPEGLVEI